VGGSSGWAWCLRCWGRSASPSGGRVFDGAVGAGVGGERHPKGILHRRRKRVAEISGGCGGFTG
jgi:hypothetical protein